MRRILIAEDDDTLRRGYIMLLEIEGYETREARDGHEALSLLSTAEGWRPDVVLLDLMMPGMNGWQFRETQLADDLVADIPIVILSGDSEAHAQAASLQANGYLQKPFKPEALLDVLAAVVEV